MPHPSSLLACALAVGVAGGVAVDAPAALILSIAMSAAWATALLGYRRGYARAQLVAIATLVAGAGWIAGAHAIAEAIHPSLRRLIDERAHEAPVVVEGRLREDAVTTESGAVLRIDVERVAVDGVQQAAIGGISVAVAGALQHQHVAQWTAGRLVRAPALLRRPARYLNPGLPDQERALARRGIALVGTIKSAALVEVVARGHWWQEAAAAARARTRDALRRYVWRGDGLSSGVATAILIGDRAALTPEVERRLQEAGTYHVIAISGGNIALLAAMWLGALRVFGVQGRLAALTGIAVLVMYSLIAVAGASVLRATLMAIIYLAVRVIDHRTAAVNAVSVTAGMVLLMTPLAIADVGFWLTFGATLALLNVPFVAHDAEGDNTNRASRVHGGSVIDTTGGQPRTVVVQRSRSVARRLTVIAARAPRVVWMMLVATIGVELALAPISAFVFQRVTIAGLLLNLVAIPAMTVVQVGALAVVGCDIAHLPRVAGWLGIAVHASSMALTESARLLDYTPWLTWRVPPPAPVVMATYYVALAAALRSWHQPWRPWIRRVAVTAAAGLFIWIVAAPAARIRARGDGTLHLTLLDVRQGDAMLVTFPNGRTLVVDTGASSPGGEFDIGDRVIGPVLRARGLLALDYLAVTHGNPDHIGGAQTLLREFVPAEVWWGVPVARHAATGLLQADARRRRIGWRTLQRGDRIDIGEVEVRVHHPPPPDWERQRVRNNDSLVIELRVGEVSVLMTGDIGREVEADLLATLDLLPTVVLKVAHHGSATSSSQPFLEHVQPRVALIGVGRGNPYGHPVPAVLGRLHDAGAMVFRTDLDGQIEVITDGRELTVRTFYRSAVAVPRR